MTNTMHAHFTRTSQDCDGQYHNDYVVVSEFIGDNAEHDFHEQVIGLVVNTTPDYEASLKVDSDGDLEYHEATEEGFRHVQVRFCTHECDETVSLYRDLTAERAGY